MRRFTAGVVLLDDVFQIGASATTAAASEFALRLSSVNRFRIRMVPVHVITLAEGDEFRLNTYERGLQRRDLSSVTNRNRSWHRPNPQPDTDTSTVLRPEYSLIGTPRPARFAQFPAHSPFSSGA